MRDCQQTKLTQIEQSCVKHEAGLWNKWIKIFHGSRRAYACFSGGKGIYCNERHMVTNVQSAYTALCEILLHCEDSGGRPQSNAEH